jgi:lipopolysaccharide transport system permease protein
MNNNFDWEIESKSKLIDFKIKDVWEYRDLLFLLVRRDFVAFYKQTILGPLWFFLQPLLTTIMFTFVFGKLGGFKTDGLPQPLFYMAGVTTWNYFGDCLTKTSTVFKDNANLFGKVYFPRLIIPFSIVISNLVKFGVQMILFILMILYYVIFTDFKFQPNAFILLFPIIIVMMAFLGLGLGMIISAMTTKYRDLSYLVTFGVQLLMYATTVVYPLSTVKKDVRNIIELNPMTSIIETFRYGFLGTATFQWSLFLYSIVFSVVVLILGIIIFNRVERTFVDTV